MSTALSSFLEPGELFRVESSVLDDLRGRTYEELARRGYHVRALSFTPGGTAAYVEVRA